MVSVTSRVTTGVTETAGGGGALWAPAMPQDVVTLSAHIADFQARELRPGITVLLTAKGMPRSRYSNFVGGHAAMSSWPSVRRREFARHDGVQECTQLRGALGSEGAFKSLLRRGPSFASGL